MKKKGSFRVMRKKIPAKSGRRKRRRRTEKEEENAHPCTVALDCPFVRPSIRPSRTNCRALGPQDGSWITCILDSRRGSVSRQ